MAWHCIPVALIACGAFVITPIPHIGGFVKKHPLPACQVQAACHMVWEPDARPVGYTPGLIYRPAAPYAALAPDNRSGVSVIDAGPIVPVSVPEPAALLVFSVGAAGIMVAGRRK